MTIALALSLAIVAFVVATLAMLGRVRAAQRQLDAVIRLYDDASEAHRSDVERLEDRVTGLLNRIQAPEAAPFIEQLDPERQHASVFSDEDYWEAQQVTNG